MTGPLPINTGVCTPWVTGADATLCCPDIATTDTALLDTAVHEASDLLFLLSGSRYPGICETTVDACADRSCWEPLWPRYAWAWGWGAAWGYGYPWQNASNRHAWMIRLAGYPVREILEVTIEGDVIDPADYRLQQNRYLIRIDGHNWPACHQPTPDTGVGTFFIHYLYGLEPPIAGQAAAAELACAIVKACPGSGFDDCEIPVGTVQVARQGITINVEKLGLWLLGSMRTGMPLVDAFLSTYGQQRRRRTALLVPENDPWPIRVG